MLLITRLKKTAILFLLMMAGLEMSFCPTVQAADTVVHAGTALMLILPVTAYASTFVLDDKEGRMQFYKSFVTNLVVTDVLKVAIDKKRPNGKGKSFPSGHTSAAFQAATFIQQRYGWKYSIPSYIAATFVGYSRVQSDNHYNVDVFAGAAIGMLSSYYFTKPYKGFEITPYTDVRHGLYGVSIARNW